MPLFRKSIADRILQGLINPREQVQTDPVEIIGEEVTLCGGAFSYLRQASEPLIQFRQCKVHIRSVIDATGGLYGGATEQSNTCVSLIDCYDPDVLVHTIGGDCGVTMVGGGGGRIDGLFVDALDAGVYLSGDAEAGPDLGMTDVTGVYRGCTQGVTNKRETVGVRVHDARIFDAYKPIRFVGTPSNDLKPGGYGIIEDVNVYRPRSRTVELWSSGNIVRRLSIFDTKRWEAVAVIGDKDGRWSVQDNVIEDVSVHNAPEDYRGTVQYYRGARRYDHELPVRSL